MGDHLLASVRFASEATEDGRVVSARTKPAFIAVVAPVYRGEEFVEELSQRLHRALSSLTDDYQIVFVDDGSPDAAWGRIEAEAAKDPRVLGIQLSRNFGQHYAITAGLDHVDADWVVVMDADLQDTPEDIIQLYEKAVAEDFDVVIAVRSVREDPVRRKLGSLIFNKLLRSLSGLDMSSRYGNFRIMSRKVHEAFSSVRENMRFYPAIMQWLGFRIGYQETHRPARASGRSSYDFKRLLRLALQATVAYSERPLHVSIVLGMTISVVSFVFAAAVLLRKLIWGFDVTGWTSLITVISFLGGLQILLLGIVGLYVGKLFQEAKKRPLYLIRAFAESTADRPAENELLRVSRR